MGGFTEPRTMVDADAFRGVMGNFATGVTVVTLPSEPVHGLTANAIASVSLEPPLVLVCVDHGTTTYEFLEGGGVQSFCVNVLSADQQHLGEYFADMRELDENPFEAEPTTTAATGAPVFEDSLAYVDCDVWDDFPAGDHTVYIGEARAAEVLDGEADGLTFFRGHWGTIS